jgi:hypothetical protein
MTRSSRFFFTRCNFSATPQDARREEGMTGRLLAKNTRNVLIARYLAARALAAGDAASPAAGVLPQRKRYARTRRTPISIASSDPKSPYTFSSLRRGNFDKVMSQRMRSWGNKPLRGGHSLWLQKLKFNLLWQIKDRARAGIELDEDEVSGLQLAHFQVADVMDVKRDGATLRYVASNRYRKRAARYVADTQPAVRLFSIDLLRHCLHSTSQVRLR